MQEILKIKDLQIELKGHIIINGQCVWRRNEWFTLAKYIGLLAATFDINNLVSKDSRLPLNERRNEERQILPKGTSEST